MMNDLGGTGKDNERNGARASLPRRPGAIDGAGAAGASVPVPPAAFVMPGRRGRLARAPFLSLSLPVPPRSFIMAA